MGSIARQKAATASIVVNQSAVNAIERHPFQAGQLVVHMEVLVKPLLQVG